MREQIRSQGEPKARNAFVSVTIQTSAELITAVPAWFGEVAVTAHALEHLGVLATIEERVRFARRRFGHYDLVDFVAVLLGYAISGERTCSEIFVRTPRRSREEAITVTSPNQDGVEGTDWAKVWMETCESATSLIEPLLSKQHGDALRSSLDELKKEPTRIEDGCGLLPHNERSLPWQLVNERKRSCLSLPHPGLQEILGHCLVFQTTTSPGLSAQRPALSLSAGRKRTPRKKVLIRARKTASSARESIPRSCPTKRTWRGCWRNRVTMKRAVSSGERNS
jgi:hypothetical protein